MKKLAIFLLTVFTIGAASLCGCAETNKGDAIENVTRNTENVQTTESEDDEQERHCPECPEKPEFPNREKRGGKPHYPHPHRPHLHPDDRLPQPKTVKPQDNKD